MPNPQGADETDEWVELYNSNNLEIDLSSWQLQDITGTITTFTIPSGTTILSNNFLVFKRPETKIMLNNDEDGINLLTPDKKIIHSTRFSKAPLGQSYSKTSSGEWQWNITPTPGHENAVISKISNSSLPSTQNSDNNGNIKAEDLTAGLNQSILPRTSPWLMFLIVLSSTIVLAIIVLFIKFKIKN
jgi:hypothetical protein